MTNSTIEHPVPKFLIGVIAGVGAIFIPRLTAALSSVTESSNLNLGDYFPSDYLWIAFGFSIFIGLIMVIMEWKVPKEPHVTFALALGVPALFTGGFNTAAANSQYLSTIQQKEALTELLSTQSKVPLVPTSTSPRPKPLENEGQEKPLSFRFNFFGNDVYAADFDKLEQGTNFIKKPTGQFENWSSWVRPQTQQNKYAVVLSSSEIERSAAEVKVTDLMSTLSQSSEYQPKIVKEGGKYWIIDGITGLTSRSKALIRAIRIKEKLGLSTAVLELKP